METFSTRQLAAIASANKSIYWIFRVQDNLGNVYYWSTGTVTTGTGSIVSGNFVEAPGFYERGEWEYPHTFKIVNFSGITMRRSKSESGVHAPNDVSFSIVNASNALDAANFIGGTARIALVVADATAKELCGSWRFRIKSASPYGQQIDVVCEDFLQEFLVGSYPNTRLISDIFPVADGTASDNVCVPEPYGTCYIPLRSVYAGADRHYLLGDPANTFTIDEVRSPRALGSKIVWTSAGFTFSQSTVSGWRMFQPLIAGGTNGLFLSGSRILDLPTKFSRADTMSLTNPADIIRRVLLNMGIDYVNLNHASFDAARDVFASWGLEWNFAFWYKEDRRAVLSRLLSMCHASLIVGEMVTLNVLSKTSQATVTNASVLMPEEIGQDSFRYADTLSQMASDSGYVAFQQAGESQDEFIKALVPAKSATDVIDGEILTLPGVQDTQHVQILGTLYYQRKFLKRGDVSFTAKGTLLALRPDDVITIDYADYGGTYNVLIDEIAIKSDASVDVSCQRFAEVFDDWGDLSPGAITIASDTPTGVFTPVISGPDTTVSTGNLPNSLPGRLRVGQATNYILLEPASPTRVSLYASDIERLRIGNLNGFLGYVTDIYGIAVGDTSKYLKYDPTNGLRLGGAGVARIELDLELARISVKDATDASKTAMGYLNGLAKHDGSGNWGSGDYGFWAADGDHLKIDGDAVYKSGDWIVENDGAYLIQNAADQTIVRLGTVSGVKGLYVYDTATPTQNLLAKFATDGLYIGTAGETNNYLKYTIAGGLVIRGGLNADDITAGTLSASRIAAGTITATMLSFSDLSGLNATEGSKLAGIEAGATVGATAAQVAAIGDAQAAADDAQADATSALGLLSDIAADAKITPVDKLALKPVWDSIVVEATDTTGTIPAAAIALGVAHTTFDSAYATLYAYVITSLNTFGDMAATTSITRATWDADFKAYFDARTALVQAIAAKAATLAAWSGVSGAGKPADNADVTLSAVNGGLAVTGGGITLTAGGSIKGGQTDYATGTGFFIGYSGDQYKFSFGNDEKYIKWDGTDLRIGGNVIVTDNIDVSAISWDKMSPSSFTTNPGTKGLKVSNALATGLGNQRVSIYADNIVLANSEENQIRTSAYMTLDANTLLLLHFDNDVTDATGRHVGESAFTNSGLSYSSTVKKFSDAGGYSLVCDGAGYVSAPDHADFDFSGGIFSVDFWCNLTLGVDTSEPENNWVPLNDGEILFHQRTDASNYMQCKVVWSSPTLSYYLLFEVFSGGTEVVHLTSQPMTRGGWMHVAIVEDGDTWKMFFNGTLKRTITDANRCANYTGFFYIGAGYAGANACNGYIDEFRISNVARWTASFAPATYAYGAGTDGLVCDLSVVGANGLDAGSLTANTGYYLYFIYNPTTLSLGTLASTSATAPTMPSGYTYRVLVGWCTTDETTTPFNIEEFTQIDDMYLWEVAQTIRNAVNTSTTTEAVDLSSLGALGYAVCPPNITKTVALRWHWDTGAGAHWWAHPVTFANAQTVYTTDCLYELTSYGTATAEMLEIMLVENQKFYLQGSGAGELTLKVIGFRLK